MTSSNSKKAASTCWDWPEFLSVGRTRELYRDQPTVYGVQYRQADVGSDVVSIKKR